MQFRLEVFNRSARTKLLPHLLERLRKRQKQRLVNGRVLGRDRAGLEVGQAIDLSQRTVGRQACGPMCPGKVRKGPVLPVEPHDSREIVDPVREAAVLHAGFVNPHAQIRNGLLAGSRFLRQTEEEVGLPFQIQCVE